MQWVPWEENALADALSREVDFDDWGFLKYFSNSWIPCGVCTQLIDLRIIIMRS